MTAKNLYHQIVTTALEKEGWTVAGEPYPIERMLFRESLTLGIEEERENWLEAKKGGEKIAVEVKSFLGHSVMLDYHGALGLMLIYQLFMPKLEPDRKLLLAIPEHTYLEMQNIALYQESFKQHHISFLVFDIDNESIVLWQEN